MEYGKKRPIPGYTGCIPIRAEQKYDISSKQQVKRIPGNSSFKMLGYQGYVPSIASENMYGSSFSKLSVAALKSKTDKGTSLSPEECYKTMAMASYTNPRTKKYVNPLAPEENEERVYGVSIPEYELNNFWGTDSSSCTDQQMVKRHQWSFTLKRAKKKY